MRNSFALITDPSAVRFQSDRVAALYRYWLAHCQGNRLPRRADIDPAEIKSLLPYLMMVDLTDNPLRIRYRLVGTEVARYAGLDFTNAYLDELQFEEYTLQELLGAYRAVIDSGQACMGFAGYENDGKMALQIEFLFCPLSDDGITVNRCMVIEDYYLAEAVNIEDLPPITRL
jgi:hypothetical protein